VYVSLRITIRIEDKLLFLVLALAKEEIEDKQNWCSWLEPTNRRFTNYELLRATWSFSSGVPGLQISRG